MSVVTIFQNGMSRRLAARRRHIGDGNAHVDPPQYDWQSCPMTADGTAGNYTDIVLFLATGVAVPILAEARADSSRRGAVQAQ